MVCVSCGCVVCVVRVCVWCVCAWVPADRAVLYSEPSV